MKQEDIDDLLKYLDKRKTSYNDKDVCEFYIKAHKTLQSLIAENEKLKADLLTKDSMLGIFEEQHEALTSKYEALELLIIDLNKRRAELNAELLTTKGE